MTRWKKLSFIGPVLILTLTSAAATPFLCNRPNKPSCVSIPFDGDETMFQLCKDQIRDYKMEMERYFECLRMESDDAADEYKSTVRSFNCNTQGTYC